MIRKINISPSLLLIVLVMGMFSCRAPQTIQRMDRNMADIYNPSRSSLHPDFNIHHINDSSTVVYLRIYPAELLFNQANETGDYLAYMTIRFYLFEVGNNNNFKAVNDSASITKVLNRREVRNSYFSALPLKAKNGKRYTVRIDVEDENRGTETRNYLVVDKRHPMNDQNFRVLSVNTGYPLFTRNFTGDEKFRISFNRMGYDSIYVDYYDMDRTLPRPIFSSAPDIPLQEYPDSAWVLPYSDTMQYSLHLPGIYKFKMEKGLDKGLSLFNFGKSFPRSKTTDDLLAPLVYLTSSAEFRDLRMEPNRKLAIDNFWLEAAGNMDDARELIRVYYNRVLYSNLYFSSFKEGWKTDRGMIYMIFGPPDILEKFPDQEKWTYLTSRSRSPVEFLFNRRENRFSNNNYVLDRKSSSTSLWAEAVNSWREGEIYSLDY